MDLDSLRLSGCRNFVLFFGWQVITSPQCTNPSPISFGKLDGTIWPTKKRRSAFDFISIMTQINESKAFVDKSYNRAPMDDLFTLHMKRCSFSLSLETSALRIEHYSVEKETERDRVDEEAKQQG